MCPITAIKALKQMRLGKEGRLGPLCRRKDNSPLTGRILNKYLKRFLAEKADYLGWKLSSHSFRAGLATALRLLVVWEEEIKAKGRWKSDTFNLYVKRGRVGNLQALQKMFCQILGKEGSSPK